MSIRARLLLLVLAVWLPAVAGFAWLAYSTYQKEAETARQHVLQLGQNLRLVIERELDKRAIMARTLAASFTVREDNIARFHEEASLAVQGTDSWAFIATETQQLANTRVPWAQMRPLGRAPEVPMVRGDPEAYFVMQGPVVQQPVIALLASEPQQRYNIGVSFDPAVLQAIMAQLSYPEGSLAAVVDQRHRVVARSRDPQKWIGKEATGDLKRRIQAGEEGFAESVTLDGVPSLSYLSNPSRYGWHVVIALPLAALTQSAQRVTTQAVAASGTMLLIGLLLAVYAARRISAPVQALEGAAEELGRDAVPPRLVTGVTEADVVSAALHAAGMRSHDAARTLEQRVADAVRDAKLAQAQLLEAQKHEAIGRLTGGLAHDFNNLLQTISTGHHVLQRSVDTAPAKRALEGVMRATSKAADLIRQMLTFGRTQPLKPQAVDFDDFILKNQELTSKAMGSRVALTVSVAPGLPPLYVDPVQMELALLNLVFNARDALPGEGRVQIVARPADDADAADTATLPPGRYVCIEVVDDGPGMDDATAARAFEPFFTTKPVGQGSGLGLAQVLAFARQSGGDARLVTAPGAGTRVLLLLPASDAPAADAHGAGTAAQGGATMRVLMVEDDALVASVVVAALEHASHRVTLCGNADAAIERLSTDGCYDVLFTDVVMPGPMTGMDLVAWCAQHHPQLPAVIATGYTAQQTDLRVQVLRKPYSIDALLIALHGAMRAAERDSARDSAERAAARDPH